MKKTKIKPLILSFTFLIFTILYPVDVSASYNNQLLLSDSMTVMSDNVNDLTTTTTVTTSDTGLANQTNSTTVTIPPLNADIVFKDEEIMLEVGEEKSFEYTVTGAEDVSFFSISDIRIVNNTFSDGKGVITLKTSRYSWGDDMVCTLRSGEAFVEKLIPVHVAEPTTFYCPDCGRTVPISERISGPLRSICRDCYEAGHYIGTTAPMRTTNTTTTTTITTVTTSDSGLANQTNSTTVTVPPLYSKKKK